MRLINLDDCDRELFYKQCGGKDNFITIETAFDMLMALPVISEKEIRADAIEEFYNRLNRNKVAMNTAQSPWNYVEVAYREMNGIV